MAIPIKVTKIVNEVIKLLDPFSNLKMMIEVDNKFISIDHKKFDVGGKRIHIFGAGKAASFEVEAFKKLILDSPMKNQLDSCVALTKDDHTVDDFSITQFEGSHPVIGQKNIQNTEKFIDLLQKVAPEDYLVFLLSGGASALLEKPIDGLTFEGLKRKHEELLASGLNINEMNRIRKSLSLVKDGGLLNFIKTKNIIQFITCDIPNEKLSDVSSGPLLVDGKTEVLNSTFKTQSASKLLSEFCSVGENRIKGKVYDTLLGKMISDLIKRLPKDKEMLVSGGEATIEVPSHSGKGGRNTHFVLAFAQELYKDIANRDIHILSLGTDGGDGPTDAAGAYINYELFKQKRSDEYLNEFNSYNYFKEINSLIISGPTKTNVMDFRILWRE
ncbi:MAG: glycerate-2-kinase [Bacteriovoracaceae bacterium]|jgi:glycerate 2-kinase